MKIFIYPKKREWKNEFEISEYIIIKFIFLIFLKNLYF